MKALTVLVLALVACGGSAPEAPADTPAAPTTAAPAPEQSHVAQAAAAGVVPGSHADWCGEHAVPESQCTRCNAELVPAFQATDDWCPEHGLPESQCLQCNPALKIERPPKDG